MRKVGILREKLSVTRIYIYSAVKYKWKYFQMFSMLHLIFPDFKQVYSEVRESSQRLSHIHNDHNFISTLEKALYSFPE